jgi:hypothetical protein
MTEFERVCRNCDETFELALPEGTVTVGYDECDNDNLKNHNLELKVECKNCNELNTFYYCKGQEVFEICPLGPFRF